MSARPAPAQPKEMRPDAYRAMYELEGSHWWFVGRRRIIRAAVGDALGAMGAGRGARLLDVGCGTGANLEMLGELADAEGIDVSPDALAFCARRGLERVRLGTIEQLPYADGAFDVVTALDVIEHLDDDLAGLRQIARVLRGGGRAIFFVPAFMFLWGVQDEVSRHRRRYTRPGFVRAVEAAGLRVERVSYANITLFAPILAGRALMKLTGYRPRSENDLNLSALNGVLGRLLGAERHWLRRGSFPFGVSILCVARRPRSCS